MKLRSCAAVALLTASLASPAAADAVAIQAGGAVIVKPKYEGAKSYDVTGAPLIAPSGGSSEGWVQFKGIDDLRFRLLNLGGLEAGPLVGYRFGRDESDGDLLRGLGDVDGGIVAGGFVAYDLGVVKPFLSYHHQISGDDVGAVARIGAELAVPLAMRARMTLTGGVTWADDDYMQSFFGVTAAQSATSLAGLARFDAEAGFKDAFVGLSTELPLNDRLTLRLAGRYSHLLGDAADSPVTESVSQWSGSAGLTYRFVVPR